MRASYEETCGLVSEPTTTLSAHKDIRTSWPPLHAPFLSISLSLSGAPYVSLGHRAFIAAETTQGPQCMSQAQHHL